MSDVVMIDPVQIGGPALRSSKSIDPTYILLLQGVDGGVDLAQTLLQCSIIRLLWGLFVAGSRSSGRDRFCHDGEGKKEKKNNGLKRPASHTTTQCFEETPRSGDWFTNLHHFTFLMLPNGIPANVVDECALHWPVGCKFIQSTSLQTTLPTHWQKVFVPPTQRKIKWVSLCNRASCPLVDHVCISQENPSKGWISPTKSGN